jgi:hypothetical protein
MFASNTRRLGTVGAVFLGLALAGCGAKDPETAGGPPNVRRLTETQYRNIVADVFGSRISVGGQFDPLVRTGGLYALGARSARMTPSGLEQFDRMANAIAAQVTSGANRDLVLPCAPADAKAPDDACAHTIFGQIGRLLYRRTLSDADLETKVVEAHKAALTTANFYDGIASGLAGMLVSPQFLFVVDTVEKDKVNPGKTVLTAYAKATRLSFFLWNTTPNDDLLTAAEKGELDTPAGFARQADIMLASPRLESGMRAFFSDMLGLDDFDNVEKDSIIYPAYSLAVANDAKEQTLRTITDLLIARHGDYRDLFTTKDTFMSGPLGRVYRVPVTRPDGGWMPYRFAEDDPHAGILTLVSFDAQYAHPGRSSPTLRGRAIREALLCQKVPDPPGDVDFSKFNDPDSPNKTARQRLEAHRTNEVCAGCHKVTDPIGLALEHFDGAGQVRDAENGVTIDASGDLDGVPYADAAGLGRAMRDNPAVPACIVQRQLSYALGRVVGPEDRPVVDYLSKQFAGDGYRLPGLMRNIVLSKAFLAVSEKDDTAKAPAGAKEKSP